MPDFRRLAVWTSAEPADETPQSWLRMTISLLWDNLASLVLLNAAGSLIAAPLIMLSMPFGFLPFLTVSALTLTLVIGGLLGAVSGEWREEPGTMRQRFLTTIRQRWLPLLTLGLLTGLCVGSSLLTTAQVLSGADVRFLALWVIQSVFLVMAVVLLIYALPLAAGHDVGPRLALRNALVLSAAAPLATLGMIGMLIILTILLLWVGLGLWLVVPVIAAVFLATNCEHQIERVRGEPSRT